MSDNPPTARPGLGMGRSFSWVRFWGALLASALPLVASWSNPTFGKERSCYAADVIRVSIGRDVFTIPVALSPSFEAADGEVRSRAELPRPGDRLRPGLCQRPQDKPRQVNWINLEGQRIGRAPIEAGGALASPRVTIVFRSHANSKHEFANYSIPAMGSYYTDSSGKSFVSKERVFLGSKIEIGTIPGVTAHVAAFVGKDSLLTATLPLYPGQRIPPPESLSALKSLTSFLMRPSR